MITDTITIQNVALVYLETPSSGAEEEIAELKELIRSAYGNVKLFSRQARSIADPKTFIGSGKVKELKLAIETLDCPIDVVIFSQRLSSLQRKNLQEALDLPVIDHIDLILDIFALRATSAEGKKQVELAQLSYSLATRPEKDYSRQGGGIGTRGPGETQLETDKRIARNKMHHLRQELAQIEQQRSTTRKKRLDNGIFTVALVGYTNAGKSTLFNKLTNNDVYADDRLFATLDTTVRKCNINGFEVLFCDTVGFIRNLPTLLIEAFKSTLEEVKFADLILNVCDISNPDVANHIAVTEQVLADLGVNAPIVHVYNKCDKVFSTANNAQNNSDNAVLAHYDQSFATKSSENSVNIPQIGTKSVYISALTGKNLDVLTDTVHEYLMSQYAKVKLKVPYAENGKVISQLQKYATQLSTEYLDDSTLYRVTLRRQYLDIFMKYIVL